MKITPLSQITPNEILVHGPESLLAWCAEDVPSNRGIKERILPMDETARGQQTEGQLENTGGDNRSHFGTKGLQDIVLLATYLVRDS
jgi:hypothetical protein